MAIQLRLRYCQSLKPCELQKQIPNHQSSFCWIYLLRLTLSIIRSSCPPSHHWISLGFHFAGLNPISLVGLSRWPGKWRSWMRKGHRCYHCRSEQRGRGSPYYTILKQKQLNMCGTIWLLLPNLISNVYIYAFSRRFYPKRLTVHSDYKFFVSMCVPWELNPLPFALLTQCFTTEPQEQLRAHFYIASLLLWCSELVISPQSSPPVLLQGDCGPCNKSTVSHFR